MRTGRHDSKSANRGAAQAPNCGREKGTRVNELRTRIRLGLATLVVAVIALAALTGTTSALASSMSTCPTYTMTQPFQKWADTGLYFLGPGGDFEGTLTGWTATGSAKIVSGNEPNYVTARTDKYSVSLPNGSSIKSPSVCVTTSTPDLRIFVRNTGASAAKLNVNMTYTNSAGKPATVTVASLSGGSTWSLSPVVNFMASIAPLVNSSGQTWVTFTFAPVGTNGAWQVDDFYVDPLKIH